MVSFGFEIRKILLLLLLILLSNATAEKVDIVTSETISETPATVSPGPVSNVFAKPEENISEKPEANISEKPKANIFEKPEANISKKPATSTPPKPVSYVSRKPVSNISKLQWAAKDSYVKAYIDLRKGSYFKRNDQYDSPDSYNTVIRSSYLSDAKYPSLTQKDNWMNPTHSPSPPLSPTYEYDHDHDHDHDHTYSPPSSSLSPIYGHHHYYHHHYEDIQTPSYHEKPYSSPSSSIFAAIHKKLSFKLILKIILKLVLFKMVVKFIAVLCLLLFIPTLKSKEMTGGSHVEHGDRMRSLDMISNYIWNSIEDRHSALSIHEDDDDETKKIKEIAELTEDENPYSGPESAVRFLEFCIDVVNRIAELMMRYLKRQKNDEVDLKGFLFKKLKRIMDSY